MLVYYKYTTIILDYSEGAAQAMRLVETGGLERYCYAVLNYNMLCYTMLFYPLILYYYYTILSSRQELVETEVSSDAILQCYYYKIMLF